MAINFQDRSFLVNDLGVFIKSMMITCFINIITCSLSIITFLGENMALHDGSFWAQGELCVLCMRCHYFPIWIRGVIMYLGKNVPFYNKKKYNWANFEY
jgi:hypothetical protein